MMIYETAPAKINLTLDTLFKRDDGYHEVEMLMTTIDLKDQLTFQKRRDKKIVVEIDHSFVPDDHRNLAYRAAVLMYETYDIPTGVSIEIDKHIPVSAGLAGGSSDAAATMRGINRLFELNIPLSELSVLAAQVGSDVPFCIYNKTALCKGRGEILTFVDKPPSAWVVVAKPNIGMKTPEVYAKFDVTQEYECKTEACLEALRKGDYLGMCRHLSNHLEPVSMSLHEDIAKLKDNMLNSGADGALMSGSGPTVYALTRKERQAQKINNAVHGCCNEVYVVRLLG